MAVDKGEAEEVDQVTLELSVFKCAKHDHYANQCKLTKWYNYGKAIHIAKYCWAERKKKKISLLKKLMKK